MHHVRVFLSASYCMYQSAISLFCRFFCSELPSLIETEHIQLKLITSNHCLSHVAMLSSSGTKESLPTHVWGAFSQIRIIHIKSNERDEDIENL